MALQGVLLDSMKAYAQQSVNGWNLATGCLLQGCKKMYEATGEDVYKDAILRFVDSCVDADGGLNVDLSQQDLSFAAAGNLLYFAYDLTGDEKYRKAIETMMERVNAQPRLAGGSFCYSKDEPAKLCLEGLYMIHPFYLEYENRFNDRKNYYDVSGQFKTARKLLYREEAGLYSRVYAEGAETADEFQAEAMGLHMMAMVDSYDLTSEELYDCMRTIGDGYREAIKGMIEWHKSNKDEKAALMTAYSILKACRLELLLADKYQKTGEALLEEAAGEKTDVMTQGVLMLAYGEYLLLHAGDI